MDAKRNGGIVMDWPKLLTMNWPNINWVRTSEEIDTASEEIRTVMGQNSPTNAELCVVIRWMAGPEGRQEKAPSLRELIRATCIKRKNDRIEDGPEQEGCSKCLNGWTTKAGLIKGWPEQVYAVPCICAAGKRLERICTDYKDQ